MLKHLLRLGVMLYALPVMAAVAPTKFNVPVQFNQGYEALGTAKLTKPCPVLTVSQANAITPKTDGHCYTDSVDKKLRVWSSLSSTWQKVGSGGGGGGVNFVSDPYFQDGVANWTASAGTKTHESLTPSVDGYNRALKWVAAANGNTLISDPWEIPAFLNGESCQAYLANVNTSASFGLVLQSSTDNFATSTDIFPVTIASSSSVWRHYYNAETIPYLCESAKKYRLKITATGANTIWFVKPTAEVADKLSSIPSISPWKTYNPTTQGFGTVTNMVCQCRQVGSNQEIMCSFTTGTVTAQEAQVALCDGAVTNVPVTRVVGESVRDIAVASEPKSHTVIVTNGTTYVNFGFKDYTNSRAPLTKVNGNTLLVSGNPIAFHASVPVVGYESSVNTWNDRCRDPLKCEWDFSAQVDGNASSAIQRMNVPWLSGSTCAWSSGELVCDVVDGVATEEMSCNANVFTSTGGTIDATVLSYHNTATKKVVFTVFNSGTRASTLPLSINCSLNGADYRRVKTLGLQAYLDGYLKSGNNEALCSAEHSSTGVLSNKKGIDCFASCTNATTPVCTFNSVWATGETPNCWHNSSTGLNEGTTATTTTASGRVVNSAGTPVAGARTLFCHGKLK